MGLSLRVTEEVHSRNEQDPLLCVLESSHCAFFLLLDPVYSLCTSVYQLLEGKNHI